MTRPGKALLKNKMTALYCLILVAVLFFAAIIFMYRDLTDTIDNSNTLIRAISHGQLLDFYELSVQQSSTKYAANYNFIIYILFALWQTPAYLASQILGRDYLTWAWTLMWSKLLVILFCLITAHYLYKIILFLKHSKERALLGVLLYFSSMNVFFPVFICGQLEVISMTFALAGIYQYLKGNNKRFWFAFLIAVPFKMFALLLALPLVLAREKNLLKAALIWISMAGLMIVEKIIFHNSPVYHYGLQAQSDAAISGLLGANINIGRSITVFIVLYMWLLLYAYMKKTFTDSMIIYMCFYVWGTYVTFSQLRAYWIYLVAPFMILCICVNDRFIRYTVLAETIGGTGFVLASTAGGTAVFKYDLLPKLLFLPRMMTIPPAGTLKYTNLYNFFEKHNWNHYSPLFSSVFVAAALAVLVLTAPGLQKDGQDEEQPQRWLMFLRVMLLALWSALIVYAYTAGANAIVYDNRAAGGDPYEADLISPDKQNIVEQDITFSQDLKLDELVLKFNNTYEGRGNMALLYVEMWDKQNNDCIFQDIIGCSAIDDKKDLTVNLKHTSVTEKRTYTIKLYGQPGNSWYYKKAHLYPYLTELKDGNLGTARINEKPQDRFLYFEIR